MRKTDGETWWRSVGREEMYIRPALRDSSELSDIVEENFLAAQRALEGVRSAYARAWLLDHVEIWKDRCEWSGFTVAVDVKTGWFSTVWFVVSVDTGRPRYGGVDLTRWKRCRVETPKKIKIKN